MVPGTELESAQLRILGPEDCEWKAVTNHMDIVCDFESAKTLGLAWTQVD